MKKEERGAIRKRLAEAGEAIGNRAAMYTYTKHYIKDVSALLDALEAVEAAYTDLWAKIIERGEYA